MSNLTYQERMRLPLSDFGQPDDRKFPILDAADVTAALLLLNRAKNPKATKRRIIQIARRKGIAIPPSPDDTLYTEGARAVPAAVAEPDHDTRNAALLAALLLMYRGKAKDARTVIANGTPMLGLTDMAALGSDLPLSARTQAKLSAFAADLADSIDRGVAQRMAVAGLPGKPTVAETVRSIEQYNRATLIPYIQSWARHQALVDTYAAIPANDGTGRSMLEAIDWEWEQNSENPDECEEAEAASPAPYGDLIAITGSEPPVHRNCACTLEPA